MPDKLFAYGTLRFEPVFRAIAGVSRPAQTAILKGYARYRVRGADYPAIVPAESGEVEGMLYTGIGRQLLQRIDGFEGSLYRRAVVRVQDAKGRNIEAWCYLLRQGRRASLSSEPWDRQQYAARVVSRYATKR